MKYPFGKMKPGDYFFAPTRAEDQDITRSRITHAAGYWAKASGDKIRFRTQKMENGVRCECYAGIEEPKAEGKSGRKVERLIISADKKRVKFNGYWVTRCWYGRYGRYLGK